MPAVVSDTHALIWYFEDRGRLSASAIAFWLGLPLITRDQKIRASGITTIW